MTARRIRPLTGADLERVPIASERGADAVREALKRWGVCGVISGQDGELAGFATVSPTSPVSGGSDRAQDGRARSGEVAMLTGIWVHPAHRGGGLGRQLVQAAAAELVRRQVGAIEAIGHRSFPMSPGSSNGHEPHPGADTERPEDVPVGFLEAVGFRVVQPHPTAPRLRMDLTTSVRWRPDLGAAWQRLTGLVSTPVPPQPAGFRQHRQAEDAVARS